MSHWDRSCCRPHRHLPLTEREHYIVQRLYPVPKKPQKKFVEKPWPPVKDPLSKHEEHVIRKLYVHKKTPVCHLPLNKPGGDPICRIPKLSEDERERIFRRLYVLKPNAPGKYQVPPIRRPPPPGSQKPEYALTPQEIIETKDYLRRSYMHYPSCRRRSLCGDDLAGSRQYAPPPREPYFDDADAQDDYCRSFDPTCRPSSAADCHDDYDACHDDYVCDSRPQRPQHHDYFDSYYRMPGPSMGRRSRSVG